MAELTPKERLQPSLLDRLTDDEPDKLHEAMDKRVLSPQRLRESVRRDITWLLNTPNLGAVQDLSAYPEVERSTMNFGIPDLSGKPVSQHRSGQSRSAHFARAISGLRAASAPEHRQAARHGRPEQHNPNAMCFAHRGRPLVAAAAPAPLSANRAEPRGRRSPGNRSQRRSDAVDNATARVLQPRATLPARSRRRVRA